MDPGSPDDIPLTDFAAPTEQETWRASAETVRGDTSTDRQQRAAEAWSRIRSLELEPPSRSRVMNSLKYFDSKTAGILATANDEVMKAFARRTRLDIPTLGIGLATLAGWGAFAGAWNAAGSEDSGPIWALSAASATSVVFFLADVTAKTLEIGPNSALETLLQVAATNDRNPSNWSEARKQYWDREANVRILVIVAEFLDSMASVHQPDDA